MTVNDMGEGLEISRKRIVDTTKLIGAVQTVSKDKTRLIINDDLLTIMGDILLNQQVLLTMVSLLVERQREISISLGEV